MGRFCNRDGCNHPLGTHQPKYCSESCYYEEKKDRQRRISRIRAEDSKQWKEMEEKLAFWYKVIKMGFEVTHAHLFKDGFCFGISEGRTEYKGRLFEVVGRFAYFINTGPTKRIEIIEW